MELTEKQIIARIMAHGRGFVFTTKLFSALTDDSASVRTALTRLVQKQSIRRLAHGLYDFPEVHPKLGAIMPTTQKIIEAIKASDAIEVQPSGAYAANLLGLSTQIPMRIELYTNGPKKTIRIGKQEIILKPTTPKNMIGAGTKAGLILHALRQIGKDNVTDEMIKQIKSKIEEQDIKYIKKQIQFAPVWIAKIMRSLINEN
jgi:predicted transcriptional regulator of viral defense system